VGRAARYAPRTLAGYNLAEEEVMTRKRKTLKPGAHRWKRGQLKKFRESMARRRALKLEIHPEKLSKSATEALALHGMAQKLSDLVGDEAHVGDTLIYLRHAEREIMAEGGKLSKANLYTLLALKALGG
jgi:hypothetical protein